MRKIIVLFVLWLLCLASYGQDSKFALGIQFTPTITNLEGSTFPPLFASDPRLNHRLPSTSYMNQYSFSTGMTAEYFINKYFSIKSGLNYERKGCTTYYYMIDDVADYWPSDNYDGKLNLHYLTLPVVASLSTKGKLRFYMDAGIFSGLLLAEKDIYNPSYFQSAQVIDNTDKMERFDFGVILGFGLRIPMGKKLLFDFGISNNRGWININDSYKSKINVMATNSKGLQFGLKYRL
jgi:hypothetical protein